MRNATNCRGICAHDALPVKRRISGRAASQCVDGGNEAQRRPIESVRADRTTPWYPGTPFSSTVPPAAKFRAIYGDFPGPEPNRARGAIIMLGGLTTSADRNTARVSWNRRTRVTRIKGLKRVPHSRSLA